MCCCCLIEQVLTALVESAGKKKKEVKPKIQIWKRKKESEIETRVEKQYLN